MSGIFRKVAVHNELSCLGVFVGEEEKWLSFVFVQFAVFTHPPKNINN